MSVANPTSSDKEIFVPMSEDPATAIYTSFAKVYTMNPNNQTFWLPSSSAPVPVSFYFDKHRSVYRIISYDKKDLVVNSTIFPSMTFIKTSATFGLWSDTKLRTIYGLGFGSNEQLLHFSDWFEKVVKAAKTLEDNLPLPPPAPSAESFNGEDSSNSKVSSSSNCLGPPPDPVLHGGNESATSLQDTVNSWYNESCEGPRNGRSYNDDAPKSLHAIDSTIALNTHCVPGGGHRGSGDYEMDQMTTSPITKLALENLQYQREVLKVKQLEVELNSMRTTVNNMHATLQRKNMEMEKQRKESSDLKDEVEALKSTIEKKEEEIKKLEETGTNLTEKLEEEKTRHKETQQLVEAKKEEIKYLKAEVEKGEEVKKENEVLKERLNQLQSEFDANDKNWDTVEIACCDMTDLIQGLGAIQSRIKQSIPAAPPVGDL